MSDRGTRGREEKASLKPANHRERRAPIVRGAITRVDEKKGDHIEERERKELSRVAVTTGRQTNDSPQFGTFSL